MKGTDILNIRKQFNLFLSKDDMMFEFEVTSDLAKRNAMPYKIVFPGMKKYRFYFRHLIARIAQYIDFSPVKVLIYKMIGVKIGKGVFIAPDVIIDVHFPELIEIGDYVLLGWGSKVFGHDYDGRIFRVGRVKIGKGSVIGGFSFVRAGVRIGEESLVRLTSTVYKDIADHSRNEYDYKIDITEKRQ